MSAADKQETAAESVGGRCHCLIAHAQNDKERAEVQTGLDNALRTNDAHAVLVACLQLMAPCPARDEQVTR
ncbi:hypothetical protein [Streptomyces flavofungini]|uniref:hypothetical protein n=1 Tax=Streptomyces flavofungini TaxID=68200 RepID=UPI0025AF63AE|nr:hypothetical protein [Streptomyces flavofungini]WJV48926.1 hypothetical protein QUY26_27465 [Streptomyces flavofungini]